MVTSGCCHLLVVHRNEGQSCNELESNISVGTLPCEAPRRIERGG